MEISSSLTWNIEAVSYYFSLEQIPKIAWVYVFSHKDHPLRNNPVNPTFIVKRGVFTKPGETLRSYSCAQLYFELRVCVTGVQACMHFVNLIHLLTGYATRQLEATPTAHWQCSVSCAHSPHYHSWLHRVLVSMVLMPLLGKNKPCGSNL